MAQHYEIRSMVNKTMEKIAKSIERDVAKGLSKTSMKWRSMEFEYPRDPELKGVWHTVRYVGKGWIAGSTKALFEVHVEGRVAKHIYLVA